MSKGRRIPYTPTELEFIAARRAWSRRELHAAFVAEFGRDDVSLHALKQLCQRKGWKTGRDGRFEKGFTPHNKGKPMPFNPNSARTRFKKGNQPRNTKWAGHERIGKDGYVWISVEQTNPYTGYCRRYVQKHRWLWERLHGPVPDGMVLKSLDGDKTNTDPANWKLIPRALLPRLNGRFGRDYDAAPAELKPTIMAVAEVEHAALARRRSPDRR